MGRMRCHDCGVADVIRDDLSKSGSRDQGKVLEGFYEVDRKRMFDT